MESESSFSLKSGISLAFSASWLMLVENVKFFLLRYYQAVLLLYTKSYRSRSRLSIKKKACQINTWTLEGRTNVSHITSNLVSQFLCVAQGIYIYLCVASEKFGWISNQINMIFSQNLKYSPDKNVAMRISSK